MGMYKRVFKRTFLFYIIATFAIKIIILSALILIITQSDKIYKGVSIEGIDVSGLKIMEASQRIEGDFEQQLRNTIVEIAIGDVKERMDLYSLGVGFNYYSTATDAYRLGRQGNIMSRIKEYIEVRRTGRNVALKIVYNEEKLRNAVIHISSRVEKEAIDASMRLENNRFIIEEETVGRRLDRGKAIGQIKGGIEEKMYTVKLELDDIMPRVTKKELKMIKEPMSQFTTYFSMDDNNRVQNIITAASAINNSIIMPNQTFSFNKATGLRNKDNGYLEAPVIIGGEYIPDIGGGVCQVSSTLYNAALLGGLEIIERRNHSLPPGYIDKGRDATVSDNYIDFVFKNITQIPIYIRSTVKGNWLEVVLYSVKNNEYNVSIITEVIEELDFETKITEDPNLPIGVIEEQRIGRKGYKVQSYRVFTYKDGKEERELLSKDTYKALERIVVKGTKKD